jgi:hypothetical protein
MVTAKVTGVLNCFTAAPHDFSETEVNLLRAVANQSAVAIVNTEHGFQKNPSGSGRSHSPFLGNFQ